MSVIRCPRCAEISLEQLKSYAHCPSCNYVNDYLDVGSDPEAFGRVVKLLRDVRVRARSTERGNRKIEGVV